MDIWKIKKGVPVNQRKKIRRAIWIINELIERFPEIYITLRDEYDKRK